MHSWRTQCQRRLCIPDVRRAVASMHSWRTQCQRRLCTPGVRSSIGVHAFLTYTMPWCSCNPECAQCRGMHCLARVPLALPPQSSYTSRRHDRNCTCRRFHHSIRIRPVEPRPKNSCNVRPHNAYNRTKMTDICTHMHYFGLDCRTLHLHHRKASCNLSRSGSPGYA
jgi:hypothetical protein